MKSDKKLGIYYERVSTDHAEQDESMENQRRLVLAYLKRHPEIELAEPLDTYSERESAKSDERPKYSSMIKPLSPGGIDYRLVKDTKRLNRSTEVAAQLKNLARRYGFKLILLSTGQIYDINASENRMMYGFESLMNEDLVYRQSEYGRIAHHQKMEAKRLNANNCTVAHGWSKELNDMYVIEEKAAVIREIFEQYVFYGKSVRDIQYYLSTIRWNYSVVTITKWLQETAFIGRFCMNKKGSELGVGVGQKTKRFYNPKEEWVIVERPDLAIVSLKLFDLAQQMRESKKRIYAPDINGVKQSRFVGSHLFASKIYCGECGRIYNFRYADRANTIGVYVDSNSWKKKKYEPDCVNVEFRRVFEKDMESLVIMAFNSMIAENQTVFDKLIQMISDVLTNENTTGEQISSIKKDLLRIEKRCEKTRQAYVDADGPIREDLRRDYESLSVQKENLLKKLADVENRKQNGKVVEERIRNMKDAISKLTPISSLNRKQVLRFVNRITIYKDGQVEIRLNNSTSYLYALYDDIGKKELGQRINKYAVPFSVSKDTRAVSDRQHNAVNRILNIYQEIDEIAIPILDFSAQICGKNGFQKVFVQVEILADTDKEEM